MPVRPLVCCLITFIAIPITSAHFDPLRVHRTCLLRSPCNNRICRRNWANLGPKRFSSRSKNFLQSLKWANSEEKLPNTSNCCQELEFCITLWNSCASKAVCHGLWDALPHIFFFSATRLYQIPQWEQPASAKTVTRILPHQVLHRIANSALKVE